VLAHVDASVLQVHSVRAPTRGEGSGLFDLADARKWIDAYARRSEKPFLVSLPAYSLRAGFDADGRAVAVEAEAPRDIAAADVRELRVDPKQVAALLRGLERSRPAQLAGVVWFRLPTEDDRRTWSASMLRAVIAGDSLDPVVKVTFDADANGA